MAQGYFDEDNHKYVPGELSVSYQLDDGTFENYTLKELLEELEELKEEFSGEFQRPVWRGCSGRSADSLYPSGGIACLG